MTNKEIIENLRKRIEQILRQHGEAPRVPNEAGKASVAPVRAQDAYPEVQPEITAKRGFTAYTAVYAPGTGKWLHPTPVDTVLRLANCSKTDLVSERGASEEKILFLDLETTGLSGAGTVAFLTGFGRWTHRGFEITQLFLEDRDAEHEMLAEAGAQIEDAHVLVTFNGKCFDVPLLQSRFVMNGFHHFAAELERKAHLDLFPAVRKLGRHPVFGMNLKDCVERFTGLKRLYDTPSRMIPALYFMYERERDVSVLDEVFRHNRLDILDMVSLLRYLHFLLTQGYEGCTDLTALAGIGKFYAGLGQLDLARRFLEAAAESASPSQPDTHAHLRLLATVLRKQGDWDRAASIWKRLIDSGHAGHEDYLWLARYYELRLGDIKAAYGIVLDCIEHCRRAGRQVPPPVESRKRRLSRMILSAPS